MSIYRPPLNEKPVSFPVLIAALLGFAVLMVIVGSILLQVKPWEAMWP